MPFAKGNKYRLQPKYTEEDLAYLRSHKDSNIEELMKELRGRHPDVSTITFYRWIEKVASE